jgi:PBP1b-binding outer membrane lipoprotein LpoB
MKKTRVLTAVVLAAIFCGCQSQQQMVDEMQSDATQVAKQRGKFELNCPTATAQVLSKEMIQSEIMNPRWAPPQRAQYTVGVSGCDKRATYLVVCAEGGTGCVAAGAQNVVQN